MLLFKIDNIFPVPRSAPWGPPGDAEAACRDRRLVDWSESHQRSGEFFCGAYLPKGGAESWQAPHFWVAPPARWESGTI